MVRRSTWIALVIFIVLVAAAVLWPRLQKEEETQEPTPTAQPVQPLIYDLGSQIMLWIEFADAAGNRVEVERESATDDWVMVGETVETSDSFRIGSVAGQLLAMRATRTFEIELGVDTVGLDNPVYTIIIRTTAGDEIVTKVGNLTAVGSGYYLQVDDEPVVIVAKLVLDEILSILTEPPLVPTPTPEVTETALPDIEPTPTP
jgi:hypothetical protein